MLALQGEEMKIKGQNLCWYCYVVSHAPCYHRTYQDQVGLVWILFVGVYYTFSITVSYKLKGELGREEEKKPSE